MLSWDMESLSKARAKNAHLDQHLRLCRGDPPRFYRFPCDEQHQWAQEKMLQSNNQFIVKVAWKGNPLLLGWSQWMAMIPRNFENPAMLLPIWQGGSSEDNLLTWRLPRNNSPTSDVDLHTIHNLLNQISYDYKMASPLM